MKNNRQNELKVIENGEPDLSLVPESLMDAFIEALVEEIGKLNRKSNSANWFLYCELSTKTVEKIVNKIMFNVYNIVDKIKFL